MCYLALVFLVENLFYADFFLNPFLYMYQSVMKTMKMLHDLETNTESKSASEMFHAVYYFF